MDNDLPFRLTLAVLTLTLYVLHRVSGKQFPHTKRVHGVGEIMLPVTACLWTVSIIAYLFGFGWLVIRLPDVIRLVGVIGMCTCVPLSLWIYRTLGAHFSTTLQLLDNHQLVSSGPYRFVRHPMYTAFFLCVLSTSLISGSGFVVITGLTTFAIMALRTGGEEQMLLERFGTEYRTYMNTTGAFMPKFRLV